MLIAPSVADLATFTGRPQGSFTAYATEALSQAALLLRIATGITEYPSDPDLAQLAKNGIMDMADKLYLSAPHKEMTMGPFQSETIGSYSYTMKSLTTKIQKGNDTGVLWFDLAVETLKTGAKRGSSSGEIVIFEHDNNRYQLDSTTSVVPGPKYVSESNALPDYTANEWW